MITLIDSRQLYDHLERDFVKPEIIDMWFPYMKDIAAYVCPNFRERSIGLVCDFTQRISKVYTAVFPSQYVLQKIINDQITQGMLFVHHPSIWDLKTAGGFCQMDPALLDQFKERQISIYTLHLPLDHYGMYSTSKTLADALGFVIEKPFAEFCGAVCGVIGTANCKDVEELNKRYSRILGHETRLYQYGQSDLKNGRVAVCAGGGYQEWVLKELIDNDLNVLITGITVQNEFTYESHHFAEEYKINILGGTHYSTEKFACMAMCGYFQNLGIQAEFIEDVPCYEDL
ncbi:MAG: Nif3-like dinuclear metal center hexameric protein [Peptococcaceae bacterium]|nr:Nif3-like dinuclear metal center hexameric protein [Peptococcaceae bacterium]